jgi:hypothetical protein
MCTAVLPFFFLFFLRFFLFFLVQLASGFVPLRALRVQNVRLRRP